MRSIETHFLSYKPGFIGKRCAWIVAMPLETAGAICPGAFFDKAQLVQIRGGRSSLACLWR